MIDRGLFGCSLSYLYGLHLAYGGSERSTFECVVCSTVQSSLSNTKSLCCYAYTPTIQGLLLRQGEKMSYTPVLLQGILRSLNGIVCKGVKSSTLKYHGYFESCSTRAQHVAQRHPAVLQDDVGCGRGSDTQLVFFLSQGKSWVWHGDKECTNTLQIWRAEAGQGVAEKEKDNDLHGNKIAQ